MLDDGRPPSIVELRAGAAVGDPAVQGVELGAQPRKLLDEPPFVRVGAPGPAVGETRQLAAQLLEQLAALGPLGHREGALGRSLIEQRLEQVVVDGEPVAEERGAETLALKRPPHTLDLAQRRFEVLHGRVMLMTSGVQSGGGVQQVGEQRREIEASGGTHRGGELDRGGVKVLLRKGQASQLVTRCRCVNRVIVQHGERVVDEASGLGRQAVGRRELGADEVDPGAGRAVAELVVGTRRSAQRGLGLGESVQPHEHPAHAGAGPGGLEDLAGSIKLRQRRFVLAQGVAGQPQHADGLGLLGEQPHEMTRGLRGLQPAPRLLEVV